MASSSNHKILFRLSSLLLGIVCVATLVGAMSPALAANGSVVFTYDALGRITTASYDTNVCIVYSYDANGNRLSQTINVAAAGATGVWGCFNWNSAGGAKWGS